MDRNIIVGLDIGTTKVVAVVAEIKSDNYEVMGIGQHVSRGLKRGMVVNIESTMESIQYALQEAELMAECEIKRVYISIAGNHIRCYNSSGIVAIRDKEVRKSDIDRVIETAKAVHIPAGHQLLYLSARDYRVDEQEGVRDPLGMSGARLEARVHLVTGATSAIENLIKCVHRCGLEVSELLLQPIVSSDAVLKEDEKEAGVILIDIGGGTTDVAIFYEGTIRHTASIPIAGDQITGDISMALRVPIREAEFIKERYGAAKQNLVHPQQVIDIEGNEERAARSVSRQALAAVIEPRAEEILTMVRDSVRSSGYETILPYVVITGGSALLEGLSELVEDVLLKQCRIGRPAYHGQLSDVIDSPRYATVAGLLQSAYSDLLQPDEADTKVEEQSNSQWWGKVKDWMKTNF